MYVQNIIFMIGIYKEKIDFIIEFIQVYLNYIVYYNIMTSKKIANIFKKNDAKTEQTEVDKLMGISQNHWKFLTINKKEWKKCIYCENFHHKEYYTEEMNYCFHCWAWLNAHEYDIEKGIYTGTIPIEDIQKLIKKSYSIHLEGNCKNTECILNRIKNYVESKLLHSSLMELLELNKKPKQETIRFNYKNKNLNVNFEESYIVI